eukprot:1267590-Pleurochrysis_carterae.AAC.1
MQRTSPILPAAGQHVNSRSERRRGPAEIGASAILSERLLPAVLRGRGATIVARGAWRRIAEAAVTADAQIWLDEAAANN